MTRLYLAMSFALLGCSQQAPPTNSLPAITAPVRAFLGAERFEVLCRARRVESFRLDSSPSRRGEFHGHTLTRTGPDLTVGQIAELRGLLLDEGSYEFESAKSCAFTPAVAVRFHHDGRELDLLLCFSCDEWQLILDGATPPTALEDFDRVRPQLIRLCQTLFPDDRQIQALN